MPPDALIVAGGKGLRFGCKKQFLEILGIPVLKRTVHCFEVHGGFARIVVVVPAQDIPEAQRMLAGSAVELIIVQGGETRQESVRNGLDRVRDGETVLIHDGVRPFVTRELIGRVIDGLAGADGCIPALPVSDTLKEVKDGLVHKTIPRSNLCCVQTPQAFVTATILEEHLKALHRGYSTHTDDSLLLEEAGKTVRVVPGDPLNLKITFPEDLPMAEAIAGCR
ncbi:MAG TPA: 2-C-methyl-D-erythritol 4-phosphate cytidylyltransferase [Deltaproteobacteria bacterium]|nr:2-C-methyl-D-erythritol 4-phosphate cytidylyltransferase [Deltaproteobacteria bacterium]HQI81721.1 2-C-methyl-D-erythritol 4-phosphate cytidylyltransferase [Deltaproteobacteria bacterium]